MVSNGIQADTGAMSQTAQQFASVAQELRSAAQGLDDRLSTLGNFWGGDAFGQQFAANYVGPTQKLLGFAGVASTGGVPSVADSVGAWSGSYQDTANQELSGARPLSDSAASFNPTL
jgi:uncharacterized protein YukE